MQELAISILSTSQVRHRTIERCQEEELYYEKLLTQTNEN